MNQRTTLKINESGLLEIGGISCKKLAEDLVSLKGHCSKEGYLSAYGEAGKELYKYELKHLLGLKDMDFEAYKKELLEKE